MFVVKTIVRLFFLLLVLVIVLPFVLLFAGLQSLPLVEPGASLGQADVARLRVLVAEHDHLAPPGSTLALADQVRSQDIKSITIDAGHIGLAVSSKAHR